MWLPQLLDAIAWPGVTALIVYWLRQPIDECLRSLTQRKIALTAPGVSATIEAGAQQAKEGENPATERISTAPVPTVNANPAAAILEAQTRDDLAEVDPGQRESVLVHALAHSRLEGGHEFVYNRIFGSQIAGLKRLNEAGRATIADAREFAAPFIDRYADVYRGHGFEGWIGFLTGNGLVHRDGEELRITQIGRDFLIYLTAKRLTESKPF